MNIAIQPQPVRGPEAGSTLPTPDQLYAIRDTASRNGTTAEFDQYVGLLSQNEATRQVYAEGGLDIASMPFGRPDRSNTVMNYATLQGDDPFDADFGGLLGGNMIIVPPDPPAERLRGGPLPAPTVQPIPGPTRPPKVLPFTLMGEDGHLGAYIPADLRAAMGSLPDDFPIEQAFADLMNADRGALPNDDFGRGLSAVLADATRAQESQVDPEQAFGRAVAAPDGVWADRFGRALQNLGNFMSGDLGTQLGDASADLRKIQDDTAPIADFRPSQFLKLAGAKLRTIGEAQGSNVGTTEQVGQQLPGSRGTNVGRLQAQEYRAMLHDLRRKGQVGYSEGEINALPEAQLITQIERMQVLAANFRREAVVQSGQMWADLAVTLPGMVTGSNLLAARLAIPRLVATRLGPVADQSLRLALRMGGEGAIGGVSGFAVSDGPARMANAKDWAIGGAVVPLLGFGLRGGINAATGGKYLSFDNMRFKARVGQRLKAQGVHAGFADTIAESFDDWHQKNWMTFGNGNLEQAAMTPHVLDRMAQKAVREAMLPNATDAAVRETTDALMQLGRIRDEALKAEDEFLKAVQEGIAVEDASVVLQGSIGIPDPKALRQFAETLVGSGKTIDRKKYQALLKYLETAEGRLPHMRDQLAAVSGFLRGEAEGVDGLKAMVDELSQTGLLTDKKAISLLRSQLVTFNASAKAFRENLAKQHKLALQQAKDILTEAENVLANEAPEVRAWVRNDPFEKFMAKEAEYRLAMDAAAPPEALLQHRANVETHRQARAAVAKLESALGRAEEELERNITKQQERLTSQIDAIETKVRTYGDPAAKAQRVEAQLDSELEYLGAQRDLSIKEAMDATQADLNFQDGIFKRAKTPAAVAKVNDAKAKIMADRRSWLEWINSRYDEELEVLASDAHRAEVEAAVSEGLAGLSDRRVVSLLNRRQAVEQALAGADKPTAKGLRQDLANIDGELRKVPADFIELVKQRTRLQAETVDGATRIRQAHGQKAGKLQGELAIANSAMRATRDDLLATREVIAQYGPDSRELARTVGKIDAQYRPVLQSLEEKANKELTRPEAVMPRGLTRARGKELRDAWQQAKRTATEIERGVEESRRLGEATVNAAQDDLLRAVTRDLKTAELIAAKFDEMVPGAVKQADRSATARLDGMLRQWMPEAGGLTGFGQVDRAAHGLPLAHKSVPAAVRGSLMNGLRRVNRSMVDLVTGYNPQAMLGKRPPRIVLNLASQIAGVPEGTYKTLADIPIGVARQLVDHYNSTFRDAFRKAAAANASKAVNAAADVLAGLKAGYTNAEIADAIVKLTPDHIATIERESFLPPGSLTNKALTDVKPVYLKAIEQAYGLPDGTLSKQGKRLTTERLTAIELKHGLAEGSLTTAAGRLELVQKVALRQEQAVRKFRAEMYAGKLEVLDNPQFAPALADRYASSFSQGLIARTAAEMGVDASVPGPDRTAVLVKLIKRMMEVDRTGLGGPDGKKLGVIAKFVEGQLRDPNVAVRGLLHNFMLMDEELGKLGMDITPLLDDIRRSVVREHALDKATISSVSAFFNSAKQLQQQVAEAVGIKASKLDPELSGRVNKLITHYDLAVNNPGDAIYTMDEVLKMAEADKVDLDFLKDAAQKRAAAYADYHKFLRDSGYDIGEIEGYSPKVQMTLPEPAGPKEKMKRIVNRVVPGLFKQRTSDAALDLREFDALILMSRYHNDVKREFLLGDAVRKGRGIEQTLREVLASSNNDKPNIVTLFSDVTNYAQGVGRQTVPTAAGKWLYRQGARFNALRLSGHWTALQQLADTGVMMSTLAPAGKRLEYARIVAENMKWQKGGDPNWRRIYAYLDADGIGGGEYKIWDQIGMQHHEMMRAARSGQPIEKEAWIDSKLIKNAMLMMHYADRRGRATGAAVGEDIAVRALAKVPKGLPGPAAFDKFIEEFGSRILSRGQMDSIYREFQTAYTTGNDQLLRESLGKKVSSTLMFDYFPGSGSSLTRNPYLRQIFPFYSYAGARNLLTLRSIARGADLNEMAATVLFEGAALAARYGGFGKGIGSKLSMLGSAGAYLEYAAGPFEPNYDRDRTKGRAVADFMGGPGVGNLVKVAIESALLLETVAEMNLRDVNKVREVALAGGSVPRMDKSTWMDELNKRAKLQATQLSADVYDVFNGIAFLTSLRGFAEGATDTRLREDPKLFSDIEWDGRPGNIVREYDAELTYAQLLTFHFIKSSGKPLSEQSRKRANEMFKVRLEADNTAAEQLQMIGESLGKGFLKGFAKGEGIQSRLAKELVAP